MNGQKNKRWAFIIAGSTDVVLGVGIVLIGLGFFPISLADYGIPQWVALLVGGVLFTFGTWMAVYNYSRLEE